MRFINAKNRIRRSKPKHGFPTRCIRNSGQTIHHHTLEIKDRSHLTIISNASKDDDPVSKAALDFIAAHTK